MTAPESDNPNTEPADSPNAPEPSFPQRGPHEQCPHCDYALVGLPQTMMLCPECGGSLSAAAYAIAAARRMAKSHRARLALWVSPGVGIIGGIPVFLLRRALFDWMVFLFLCLWAGGAMAVYFASKGRGERKPWKIALIGLPVGVLYFATVLGIAVMIIFIIKWTAT